MSSPAYRALRLLHGQGIEWATERQVAHLSGLTVRQVRAQLELDGRLRAVDRIAASGARPRLWRVREAEVA